MEPSSVEIEQEWSFVHEIAGLLSAGGVLNTPASEPIWRFEHPAKLKELFDFTIPADETSADLPALRTICEQVIRYSVKTGHPHFHNQLFGGMDPFGLAASWITDALNTSQYTYEVAPVFTLMENELIQTFCRRFGFADGDGIFAPGGSVSNMYGMVLARYVANPTVKETGLFGAKPLVVFTSEESHYSCKKAAHWLGIGTDHLITVRTDARGRMLATDLSDQIEAVLRTNRQPFFVNATAGTTVQGSFDDLTAIADVCDRYAIWLHVDACLGGSAIMSAKHRHLLDGAARANSIAWNPHKSLGVPLQCSMLLVRQRGLLHACNSSQAQYLFQQDKFYDVSYDTGDKSVQCGRKVDVFKFWLMLRARGVAGLGRRLERCMTLSGYLYGECVRKEGFRVVLGDDQGGGGTFDYTNVCFWYVPRSMRDKAETKDWWTRLHRVAPGIKEKMCKEGAIMVGYSPLPHKGVGNFLRMTLACFPAATEASIDRLLSEIERLGEDLVLD